MDTRRRTTKCLSRNKLAPVRNTKPDTHSMVAFRQRQFLLIIRANKMHNFSNLFDKVLYMFQTGPLSIIRSISTLYTQQ